MAAMTPTTRQLVALVALVAVVAGAIVGIYALTPAAGRGMLFDRLAAWAPGGAAAIGVLLTWLGVRKVQTDHGRKLEQISEQTNGTLDNRIRGGVRDVLTTEALKVWQEDRRADATAQARPVDPTPAATATSTPVDPYPKVQAT